MRVKKEVIQKTKRLILHSERLAIDHIDYSPQDRFVDQIRVIELCNELKALLNQSYQNKKSKWKQLEIPYGK